MTFRIDLSEKTNEELLIEYKQSNSLEIKQELVLRYMHVVKSIALQMRNVYIGFTQIDDIINEGVLAVMNAIDKFEPEKNVKFETYISKRLRGLIIDIARRQDWIPRSVRKNIKDIDTAATALANQFGRPPTDQEIAAHLNISMDKYKEDIGKTNLFHVLSLDMLMEDSIDSKKIRGLSSSDMDISPEQRLLDKEIKSVLKDGLAQLKENEQLVISLYYHKELNMKEIAAVLEVSEPRVSQIHANALKKLRVYMEKFMNDEAI